MIRKRAIFFIAIIFLQIISSIQQDDPQKSDSQQVQNQDVDAPNINPIQKQLNQTENKQKDGQNTQQQQDSQISQKSQPEPQEDDEDSEDDDDDDEESVQDLYLEEEIKVDLKKGKTQTFQLSKKSLKKKTATSKMLILLEDMEKGTNSIFKIQNQICDLHSQELACLVNDSQANTLQVSCKQKSCSFTFQITFLEPKELKQDEPTTLQFDEEQELLLISLDLKIKNDFDPRSIIMYTQLKNYEETQSSFIMFLNGVQFENKFESDNTIVSQMQLSSDNKPEQKAYALLIGNPKAEATILLKVYYALTEIEDSVTYVDFKSKSSSKVSNIYKLSFTSKETEGYDYVKFIFKWFTPKQDVVTLLASGLNMDGEGLNHFWKADFTETLEDDDKNVDEDSQTNKQYSLIVAKETLQKIGQNGQNIYFMILNSQEAGFFYFEVEKQVNGMIPQLEFKEIMGGKQKNTQIQNIYFQTDNNSKELVTLKLTNSISESNIFIRACEKTKCTEAEFFNTSNLNKFYLSSSSNTQNFNNKKTITFHPSCGQNKKQCSFIIGIVPLQDIEDSAYELEAYSQNTDKYIVLEENVMMENVITQDDYQYYAFFLKDISNIKLIKIRNSSQNIQTFISTNSLCDQPSPSKCKDKKFKLLKGLVNKPVVIKGKDAQTGVIYVGVYGFSNTIYSLVVEVDRVDSKKIIQLQGGMYFQGHLDTDSPIQYFVYNPVNDSEQNKKGETNDDIEINFKGQKEKVIILVNNDGTFPYEDKENGFQWHSSTGYLFISHKDKMFNSKASYQIAIIATDNAFNINPNKNNLIDKQLDLHFQLMVTSSNVVKTLELGNPFYDTLREEGVKYYQISISNQTDVFQVSHYLRNTQTKNNKYFTFGVGSEPFEDVNQYELKFTSEQNNFQLTPEVLSQKVCNNKSYCDVYLSVFSNADHQIDYSLTVWADKYALELFEGIQHQADLNHEFGETNYYFTPNNKEHSLSIYLASIYGHSQFNVLLFDNENSLPLNQWPFPVQTDKTHNYNSGIHNSHSISFSPQSLEQCWPDCVILITVSYYVGLPNDGDKADLKYQEERQNDHYNIIVSTLYSDLHTNQQLEFTLKKYEQKFFFLSLRDVIKENDSLIIEMTTLSGDAILGVIVKDDITSRYPNSILNEKYADMYTYANYIEISNQKLKKLMDKNGIKADQNPTLVIEVGCISTSAGRFVLSALQGKSPVQDLMHGLPQEIYVFPKQTRYFKYFHFTDSDFTVKFQREIGYAQLGIRVCKKAKNSKMTNYEKCLKSQEVHTFQFTAGETYSNIHVSKDNEELYCQECLYIISLEGGEVETHAFMSVVLQQDFTWLQESRQIRDFVEGQTLNLYRISVDQEEETDVSIQTFNGNVQVYYSYDYTFDLEEFKFGPFTDSNGQIHIKIAPRKEQTSESSSKKKKSQLSYIKDYLHEAEIYLAVVNKQSKEGQKAQYSIIFNGGQRLRYVSDGQMLIQQIPANSEQTFVYHHFEYEVPARVNIFSHTNNFDLKKLNVTIFHDLMKNRRDYKEITGDQVELQLVSLHDYSMTYELPQRNGTYEILVQNTQSKPLNISLSVNARDIMLIPFDLQVDHILQANAINYYEIIAPQAGYVTVLFTHCTGDATLGFSQSYQEFIDGEYDQQLVSLAGNTYHDVIKVNRGPLFIAMINGEEEAVYKMKIEFFKSQKSIQKSKIKAGNDGAISYKREQGGQVEVTFSPIICEKCDKSIMKNAKVHYELIYSIDQEILNTLGKCKIRNYFEHDTEDNLHSVYKLNPQNMLAKNSTKLKTFVLETDEQKELSFSFKLDNDDVLYHLSIVAQIQSFDDETLTVFYNNIEIMEPNVVYKTEASIYAFIFACILVIMFFCMTTYLFYRRYKAMKKGLQANIRWRELELKQQRANQQNKGNENVSTKVSNNEKKNESQIECINTNDEFQFNLQSQNDLRVEIQQPVSQINSKYSKVKGDYQEFTDEYY